MREVELSAGTVQIQDVGAGPAVVLIHGLLMDSSLWDGVIAELSCDYRCIAPTLPLGAHRVPVKPGADLSLPGVARLVAELLERLDLTEVTLVGADTGGALVQLLMAEGAERIARAVLVSCDAFDNFPPGLTGRSLVLAGKLPPKVFGLAMQQMRLRPARRLPNAFGWLTKRGDPASARWVKALLADLAVRNDAVTVLRAIAADRQLLSRVAERLPGFDRPVLVVWAKDDRVMPPEHGQRLARLLPHAQLAEIDDTFTLVPLDQPVELARLLREFTGQPSASKEVARGA